MGSVRQCRRLGGADGPEGFAALFGGAALLDGVVLGCYSEMVNAPAGGQAGQPGVATGSIVLAWPLGYPEVLDM